MYVKIIRFYKNWYKNLVIELASKLGFDFRIEKSDLESDILI
jgi:hypothetical protein